MPKITKLFREVTQEQIEEPPPEDSKPEKPKKVFVGKASLRPRLPSLVPLTVAGAGLVVSSYLFSPDTLLGCLNLFFNQLC